MSGNAPQIVPQELEIRQRIREAARDRVARLQLVPPQTLGQLRGHVEQCFSEMKLHDHGYDDFAMIMLNNALWETWFSTIPAERRLLLLPFCLRNQAACKAERDDLGLICNECGQCNIPNLTEQAEKINMPVLIAESSSRVAEWVEEGDIQAVIGVSCMDSLEKAFPAMLRFAVPGIAVPLITGGCKDTTFDRSLLQDALAIPNGVPLHTVSHVHIRERLDRLFSPDETSRYLAASTPYLKNFPQRIVHALCGNGKHYRPMITYVSYGALADDDAFPDFLEPIALAVECFHKASLIHDDIEDDDETRYGEPTLHKLIGVPAAINAGDFLIGEGYRLLNHASIPVDIRAELVMQATQAHCELALGQAQEFESIGENITLEQCLETHRLKTAPAFRVALNMGAISARKFEPYRENFYEYADMLGMSYQLLDDLEDTEDNPASAVDCLMRTDRLHREDAHAKIAAIYETYRTKCYDVLEKINDPRLKIAMYRLTGKVLKDV